MVRGPEAGRVAGVAGGDPKGRSSGTKGTAHVLIILLLDPIGDLTLGRAAGWADGTPNPTGLRAEKNFREAAFFCLTLRAVDRIATQFE
jgi:hypothetical protein